MEVHTVWIATRGAAVAAALLLYGAPYQVPAPSAAVADADYEMSAEVLRHLPHAAVSVDQLLAQMSR